MIGNTFSTFGKNTLEAIRFLGGTFLLLNSCLRELMTPPFYFRLTVEQIYQIGVRSFSLVFITALSTGMVMSLQFGFGLEKFGGKLYVPKIVSLSIFKEIGPVFTALMMAARADAGIASEIGSMTVTQQVDAIRALGTSPIKKIVIPRLLATLVALPALAALANIVGVFGGMIIGTTQLGLDMAFWLQKVSETVTMRDYMSGFLKTFVFALIIALTACYYGLKVSGGTKGVGVTTTKAVVVSSILILISDFFLTKLFWIFERWT